LRQEIGVKEEMSMMFSKRWSDKNIKDVTDKIDRVTVWSATDTLFSISDKNELYEFFRKNRSEVFKDMISIKIK